MDTSSKEIFMKDITEVIEQYDRNLKTAKNDLKSIEDKIALFSKVEKRLGTSVEDRALRDYIFRRLINWQKCALKDRHEIQDAEDKLTILENVLQNIEKRKDDLSL